MIRLRHHAREIAALSFAGAALVAAGLTFAPRAAHDPAHADQPPVMASKITATKVSEEKLAHVPGKTVTVEIVEFPPGTIAAEHHHAGSVTAYILSGTIRSQLAHPVTSAQRESRVRD